MQATVRRLMVPVGLATSLLFAAACSGSSSPAPVAATGSAATTFPVTVQSASGPVVIRSRPTAIVSLSPTATEDLYAIGAGGQVKAVDKYSDYPAGTPKTQLSEIQLNVESLVALKPDLVVVSNTSTDLARRMKALSVPLLVLPAATKLADVYSEMAELGQATGHSQQATTESASIRSQLQAITAAAGKTSTPLTYFYELSPDYYSITSDTFVGQLLNLIGLKSIADSASNAAKSGGYPQLSSEFIVKANPDFIFLADTLCCQQTSAKVANRPGWAQMTALRAHHVVPLSDDIASRWGPRIVDLLRTVATAVGRNAGSS